MCSGALSVALLAGCSGGPPRAEPELDCGAGDDLELRVLQPMEGVNGAVEGATVPWYTFGDATPGSITSAALQPIPGGRCDSSAALVLTSRWHRDWGAGFGEYQTAMDPVDASGFEGISFWARASGYGTSTGFLLSINDINTAQAAMVCTMPSMTDVAAGAYTYNEAGMIVPLDGELPSATDCGNSFQRVVMAHREWYLHVLPFESFIQTANPNRVPTGIERSAIYQFAINIPKDSNIELWIDDFALYRRRAPEAAAPATD